MLLYHSSFWHSSKKKKKYNSIYFISICQTKYITTSDQLSSLLFLCHEAL